MAAVVAAVLSRIFPWVLFLPLLFIPAGQQFVGNILGLVNLLIVLPILQVVLEQVREITQRER